MKLLLDTLQSGLPTITENMGKFLSEAALYCLLENAHNNGVMLKVKEDVNEDIPIEWGFSLDKRSLYTYTDLQEATEYGATCIAILLSIQLTENNTVERSFKGNGFDYWLGKHEDSNMPPFQRKARLEISGIFNGNSVELKNRTKIKIRQTDVSDNLGIPAYVSVIEFSNPMASFVKK